jgi:DNA polymerase/3'-5' exonuclease PolX
VDNPSIAQRLQAYARYLNDRDMNIFRRRAYRRAAEVLLGLDRPVVSILEEAGRRALQELPGIGSHLAYTIEGLVRTGHFRTLNGEDGQVDLDEVLSEI